MRFAVWRYRRGIRINKYEGTAADLLSLREKRDRGWRSIWETSHAKIFSIEWRDPRIQSTEWLNISLGYRPKGERPRVRPREAAGDIPLSKLFFLLSSLLFLSRKPTDVLVQIAFRPAYLTAYPLARTYLIRINARAVRKLASRPARTRHPRPTFAHRSPALLVSRSYITTGNKPDRARCENPNRLRESTWTKEREREGRNGSLRLGILIRPRDHCVQAPF